MKWYLQVLKSYADFSGRSRRKEYWMFFLFNLLISIILSIIDIVLGLDNISFLGGTVFRNNGIIGSIYSLLVFIPSLAVGVRRLHDTNRSGWFLLLPFSPFLLFLISPFLGKIGFALLFMGYLTIIVFAIVLLVLLLTKSDEGSNDYGPNPKDEERSRMIHKDLLDN
ncbi:MAG: DUF805 domain-containing protein [Flavobacteriales bacterium]|jgi:uncharacterized membrane protein YhaH (DUF805 family)|nr:DUF805 domain-containing protein [Crocinitomicaceae bacterium]NBX79600.1 DUF805 domain-containing protein [Flavobacteriales bacterium]NCA21711.1 DUF805 domain-containing protein [Crocinitomicaceae bacterium]